MKLDWRWLVGALVALAAIGGGIWYFVAHRAAPSVVLAVDDAPDSGIDTDQGLNAKSADIVTVDSGPTVEVPGTTPMAQRVAVLGFLNKRNGQSRDITLKPGQSMRIGDAIVRLRACEVTAPWEPEQYTGAFVQLDRVQTDNSVRRVFSGWLFKERPSLNVVQDPLYDVWPKSCAMTIPDRGADSVAAGSLGSGGDSSGGRSRSSAAKSPVTSGSPDASPPAPAPSAAPSNPM